MRWVALAALAVLTGCITDDPPPFSTAARSGDWLIDRHVDRVTAAPVSGAFLRTLKSNNSAELASRPASLQLSCFENKPIVRIAFEFKIGSDKNSTFGYRFDDRPGRDNVDSRVLLGYQVIVIENKPAVAQFIADMAGANQLYVRVRSLNAARTSAEFNVANSGPAVQAAFADCPLTPDTPPRRTS